MVTMKFKNCFLVFFLVAAVSSDARIRRDVATSNAPQYEYVSPKDMSEIADEELKNILSQEKDNWVLTMKKEEGGVASDIYLYMDASEPLEFALDVGREAYPQKSVSDLSFKLHHPDGTSKSFILFVASLQKVALMLQTVDGEGTEIGSMSKSNPKPVTIKINHTGSIMTSDPMKSFQSQMSLPGEGVLKINPLSWNGLPRTFKLIIPSSVFRVRRLVPATTPLDSSATSNGTSLDPNDKAGFNWTILYIVIGCVAFLIVVCSVVVIIILCILKKACFKKSSATKPNQPDTPEALKTAEPLKTGDVTGTSKKIKETTPIVPPANPTAVVAVPPTSPAAATSPATISNPKGKRDDELVLADMSRKPAPVNQSAPAESNGNGRQYMGLNGTAPGGPYATLERNNRALPDAPK